MKSLMITAPSSNMGKTTMTLALARAIKNRGIDISTFKTGPDLIDKEILEFATKKSAGNLDIYLMGKENLRKSLYLNKGDIGLIEGAMGYFDGISNSFINSSYDISVTLDIPSILVYRPKGELFSIIPKVMGMEQFSNNRIKGIIFNGISEPMYNIIKPLIEEYTQIENLGYLPKLGPLELEIGDLSRENEANLDSKLDKLADKIEETVDIDRLISLAKEVELEPISRTKTDLKIAIAHDEAFRYIYNENLKLLSETFEVEYFSPLKDIEIPNVDLVYFPPAGLIKKYLKELSNNKSFLKSLKEYVERGGFLIAEGDSTLYLLSSLEGFEMANIFPFKGEFTNRLERFGYGELEFEKDSLFGLKGDKINVNEYHKSKIIDGYGELGTIKKPMSKRNWKCGYQYKNAFTIFSQINLLGNIDSLDYLIKRMGG